MTGPDDTILEFFEEKDLAAPPKIVYENIVERYNLLDISYGHLNRRIRELKTHGLLEEYDGIRGGYEISEKGRAYLAGELDRDELEDDCSD